VFRPAALLLLAVAIPAAAHETITTKLTWSAEISRIIFKRCGTCHHEGGSAFSLMSYQEARPWAKAIKEEVLERRMPPWSAVKGFGEFADEHALTMEELHLLSDWVEGGAPEGDPKYLPDRPTARKAAKTSLIRGLTVAGTHKLASRLIVRAVRPEGVPQGGSLKAVAMLPDGRVEPLIWIYNYQTKWPRNYTLRNPLRLPAGTSIHVSGSGRLVIATPVRAASPSSVSADR
jgi:hypothetical protein